MPCIPWFLSIAYATGRTKFLALAPQMLNGAIRGWITIQRISIRETNVVFHRVEIYPVDSVIRLLNNWGLVKSVRETALKCLSNPNRISERAMIGLLQNPLSICWSGWREIQCISGNSSSPWAAQNKDSGAASQTLLTAVRLRLQDRLFITTIGYMMDTRLTCSPVGLNNL